MPSDIINIYGQLHAATDAGILADAAQIQDFNLNKTQAQINQELYEGSTVIVCNTTEYWNAHGDYRPAKGEIIVYSDYSSREVDGETYDVPAIKIGTGNGYLGNLQFAGSAEKDAMIAHINDSIRHITAAERTRWNNKLNVDTTVSGEVLSFNRN